MPVAAASASVPRTPRDTEASVRGGVLCVPGVSEGAVGGL